MAGKAMFIIVGRLTRDAEIRQGKMSIMTFSLACDNPTKEKTTSFFNITMFGNIADKLYQYMLKGKEVMVEGYLKQDIWKDKTTGATRQEPKFIGNSVLFMGSNANSGSSESSDNSPQYEDDQIPF